MNKAKSIILGVVLVFLGVAIGLKTTGIINFDLFFDGWWTLLIIIPSIVSLFESQSRKGGIIGLVIGVALLLACQDILSFDIVRKLALPVVIVLLGLMLIFKDAFNSAARKVAKKLKEQGVNKEEYCATFSSSKINLINQPLKNAELTAVFGGIDCDTRGAVITQDAVISVCSIFGGVDIIVPDNVNVKISSTSIFGGVSDKRLNKTNNNAFTIYINATCLFGGCDIK